MIIQARKYSLLDTIKIPLKFTPVSAIFVIIQMVLFGIISTVQVVVTANFIDNAVSILQGELEMGRIYPSLLAVVGLIAYTWLFGELLKFARTRMQLGVERTFGTAVMEKRARLAYHHVENPETWDLISRVGSGAEGNLLTSYNNLLSMISTVLRIGGLLLLLITQVWWAALLIMVFSIPLFGLAMKSGKANYQAGREVSKHKRKYHYLSSVLTSRDTVDERTLFGYGDKLNEIWHERYEFARRHMVNTQKIWFIRMKMGSIITAIISILIVLVLLNPVLTGVLSIGMFISLVNATFGLVQMMSWELTNYMDTLARSREFLVDLTNFANLEEIADANVVPNSPAPIFETLEFKQVSFKYPGTEKLILKNASFKIEADKHYAFVGINGAGKTTIAKLIAGLYTNYTGEIFINNKSLREYSQSELKAYLNIVYQDFARYQISVKDNIGLGNIKKYVNEDCQAQIEAAVVSVGLDEAMAKLPQGLDTPLGKVLKDGQDVSGGEWQHIAMARSMFNPAPLRILDEPTAALDPIRESELYHKFEVISKGKTTIFISHRLGSIKLADWIFVIDDGYVKEQGTHEQLMKIRGLYEKMYDSQRGWYQ